MTSVSDLQQDKSFRLRVMLACIGIAFLVSSIYVVVSYRLAADLGVETELKSLEKQTRLFHSGLVAAEQELQQRAETIADKLFVDALYNDKLYISAFNAEEHWEFSQHFSREERTQLIQAMSANFGLSSGVFEVGSQQYIWLTYPGDVYDVLIVRTTSALDASVMYVAKRLSITTLIVFWVSIWSALTLSSLIAKRVRRKNEALARLATHDTLTGLPNRLYLVDFMERNLPKSVKAPTPAEITQPFDPEAHFTQVDTYASLFVIDLDKFKEVNDSLGHSAGDRLLVGMGKRIREFLAEDQLLVRTGGDEFVVWAPNIIGPSAERLARELVEICNKPFSIDNLSVNTGASIGIAYYPRHANSAETLIIKADAAMYEAKRQRCGWMVCDDTNLEDARDRLKLRADLGSALGLNQIVFYFQPKVDLATGKITGAEALARWNHPTEGILSPFHFIDLIERSGRVQEFGRYVLDKNVAQIAAWQREGMDVQVAVNLSPYNLLDPGLVEYIRNLFVAYDVPAQLLEIELTESETSISPDDIARQLREFKRLGVKVAIDDFGTGMSSLSYISDLEVNIIKIDRSFVNDVEENGKHYAVVSAAITMANAFETKLVAEGIETQSQANLLADLGCHYGQGYYYSRPLPADEFRALMKQTETLPRVNN